VSILKANCPSCAGPVEFKSGASVVVVCPFCRSAVARTDRALQDLGKVAEVMQTGSPLRVGLNGTYRGHRFQLTGRAQLKHSAGGVWDEWYATFSNGWVGWLAEAQGRFYLTFYQPLPDGVSAPAFDELQVGQPIPPINNQTYIVAEKGVAATVSAEGEIPYQLVPNEQVYFADLSGINNAFATIDYSTKPAYVFAGSQVSLEDIGLAEAKARKREPGQTAAAALGCPNCGGPLALIAPDKAERVTCQYCNSLLDINQGSLRFLRALNPPLTAVPFVLEIGAEGFLKDGAKMKIVGAMTRGVTIEGMQYYWNEYLLYNPAVGFRWLVHSDNHWNYVEPVNIAEVQDYGRTATYGGKTYKLFQDARAFTQYVKGEFYWKVETEETVRARDLVSPPFMLSGEMSEGELNWSRGEYMSNDQIETAFSVSGLPRSWNIAPNQPFPHKSFVFYSWLLLGALIFAGILMIPLGSISNTALNQEIMLQALPNADAEQMVFSEPFDLKGNRNVSIKANAPINNAFAELDFDLINEQSSEVESIPVNIEFYTGVEDGEAWSEGGQTSSAVISSVPAGKYSLRVSGNWQNWQQPLPVTVKVEQNVLRGVNFWLMFIVLAIVPILMVVWYFSFESRRWSESMFGSSASSGGDDE
jgi:hypothetical protein